MQYLTKTEYLELLTAGDMMYNVCYNLSSRGKNTLEASDIESLSYTYKAWYHVKNMIIKRMAESKMQVEEEMNL